MVKRGRRLVAYGALLFVGTLAWSQCSSPAPQKAAEPPKPKFYGEMTPLVSVRELMSGMIDPASDYIFDAIGSDSTAKGLVNIEPKTDEDWAKVKAGAVMLAEGIFLLKVPRPFTPPGDVNHSTGPNPPELSPTQIQALVEKDPVLWEAKIQAIRNVAQEVMEVVKKKDTKALFEASGDLDEACEACHLEYWYPGDKKAVEEIKNSRARFEKPGAPVKGANAAVSTKTEKK